MQARWLAPGRPFHRAITVGTEASRAELGHSAPSLWATQNPHLRPLGSTGLGASSFLLAGFQSVRFHQRVHFGDKHITG